MNQALKNSGRFGWSDHVHLGQFLPGLVTGIMMGVIGVVFPLSLASLIFAGDLFVYLPYGIGLALVGGVMMAVVISFTSRVHGVMGSVQDSPSVILAVMAAAIFSTSALPAEQKLATILVTIAITTFLTGLLFLGIGYFHLGQLVRFVPYPVIGGFLAGTGWLLFQGSFGVMTDYSLTVANLPYLLNPNQILLWLPGVVFALALFFGLRKIHHMLALPGILIGFVALFYLALAISGTSLTQAMERGLLLGQASGRAIWQPVFLLNISLTSWASVLGQAVNIVIILFLSLVSLLLNITALELATQQEIDLNRELRSAGFANLLSGLLGGLIGYHALSGTTLTYRMGGRGKLPGIITGLFILGVTLAGTQLLAYFPRSLLGGLLLYLGLDFLSDWVITGWARLSRSDYCVVLLILVVIATTNFLIGVGVGLTVMVLLFVFQYSRVSIVHHRVSGAEMRSRVERCAYHRRALSEDLGQAIQVLELQGYIFFGTANTLLDQVRERVYDASQPKVEYLILDFSRIDGIDSSAEICFLKEKQFADAQGFILVFTHLPEPVQARFAKSGIFADGKVQLFSDVDRGLEWCEEQVLDRHQVTGLHTPVTLSAQLADSGLTRSNAKRLMEYLERRQIPAGEILIHQGQAADQMYFIELGNVTVYLETDTGQRVRLQSLGLGTAVGDLGLFQNADNTTTVVADSPVIAYRLTCENYYAMKTKDPELAASFQEFISRTLSERLAATTRTLEAVMR